MPQAFPQTAIYPSERIRLEDSCSCIIGATLRAGVICVTAARAMADEPKDTRETLQRPHEMTSLSDISRVALPEAADIGALVGGALSA
jgi:hypothetical protein